MHQRGGLDKTLDKILFFLFGWSILHLHRHVGLCRRLLVGEVAAFVSVQVDDDHHQDRQQGEEHQGDDNYQGEGRERSRV